MSLKKALFNLLKKVGEKGVFFIEMVFADYFWVILFGDSCGMPANFRT